MSDLHDSAGRDADRSERQTGANPPVDDTAREPAADARADDEIGADTPREETRGRDAIQPEKGHENEDRAPGDNPVEVAPVANDAENGTTNTASHQQADEAATKRERRDVERADDILDVLLQPVENSNRDRAADAGDLVTSNPVDEPADKDASLVAPERDETGGAPASDAAGSNSSRNNDTRPRDDDSAVSDGQATSGTGNTDGSGDASPEPAQVNSLPFVVEPNVEPVTDEDNGGAPTAEAGQPPVVVDVAPVADVSEPTPSPEATGTTEATPEPDLTAEPTATVEPGIMPEPAETLEPVSTPEPVTNPGITPEPTAIATATSAPVTDSAATPVPSATAEPENDRSGPSDEPDADNQPDQESGGAQEPEAEVAATHIPAPTIVATSTSAETLDPVGPTPVVATVIPDQWVGTPEPAPEPTSEAPVTVTPEATAAPETEPAPEAPTEPETAPISDAAALVTVETISRDDQMRPGQTADYQFQVVNTGDAAAAVRLKAANQLPGWTGRIVHIDGALPDSVVVIAPHQNILVVVEVGAPQSSRFGERNTTTLTVEPAQDA